MKKLIIGILIASSLLVGCGEGVICDYSIGDKIDENYTVLDKRSSDQYLVYDNDTMILYLANLENNGAHGTIINYSLCPYYVMNENDEPVVGVYNGDEEWIDE